MAFCPHIWSGNVVTGIAVYARMWVCLWLGQVVGSPLSSEGLYCCHAWPQMSYLP